MRALQALLLLGLAFRPSQPYVSPTQIANLLLQLETEQADHNENCFPPFIMQALIWELQTSPVTEEVEHYYHMLASRRQCESRKHLVCDDEIQHCVCGEGAYWHPEPTSVRRGKCFLPYLASCQPLGVPCGPGGVCVMELYGPVPDERIRERAFCNCTHPPDSAVCKTYAATANYDWFLEQIEDVVQEMRRSDMAKYKEPCDRAQTADAISSVRKSLWNLRKILEEAKLGMRNLSNICDFMNSMRCGIKNYCVCQHGFQWNPKNGTCDGEEEAVCDQKFWMEDTLIQRNATCIANMTCSRLEPLSGERFDLVIPRACCPRNKRPVFSGKLGHVDRHICPMLHNNATAGSQIAIAFTIVLQAFVAQVVMREG